MLQAKRDSDIIEQPDKLVPGRKGHNAPQNLERGRETTGNVAPQSNSCPATLGETIPPTAPPASVTLE